MRHYCICLIGASALSLAACAGAPKDAQPTAPATAAPAIAATADEDTRTGSRIPKRGGGDRTVKTIGARDMRDAMDSQAKPFER